MLYTVLNQCWNQNPTRQRLFAHLPPISQSMQVRCTMAVRHGSRKGQLKNNVLLLTPLHGHNRVGKPALCGHWMQYKGPAWSDG